MKSQMKEMSFYRRIFRISLRNHVSNEETLKKRVLKGDVYFESELKFLKNMKNIGLENLTCREYIEVRRS